MHPVHYFEVFVEGNFYDFSENNYCLRRAFNSCVSASHMADIYFKYCKRNQNKIVSEFNELKDFINFINKKTQNKFKDIRSISNAYKHLYLDDDCHSSIASGGVLTSVESFEKDEDIQGINNDYYGSVKSEWVVKFTRKDGSIGSLNPILESVNKFWSDLIYNLLE